MTAAFMNGGEPQTLAEIAKRVTLGELCPDRALALAYGLGVRDGKRERMESEPPRVVRVGRKGNHEPEVQS